MELASERGVLNWHARTRALFLMHWHSGMGGYHWQILDVLFLRIHHHYVTYCCPYIMNVVLNVLGEQHKCLYHFTQRKRKKMK